MAVPPRSVNLERLEELVRRYIPRDSNPAVTDTIVRQWMERLPRADRVVISWRAFRGTRKLEARWFDADGEWLLAIGDLARPRVNVESFARDWRDLMNSEGRHVTLEDDRTE